MEERDRKRKRERRRQRETERGRKRKTDKHTDRDKLFTMTHKTNRRVPFSETDYLVKVLTLRNVYRQWR